MHLAIGTFIFFVIVYTHGSSLNGTVQIINCLESCQNEGCTDACAHDVQDLNVTSFLNSSANASVSLHCRNANAIVLHHTPGFYIIEQVQSNSTLKSIITNKGQYTEFQNLTSGTDYRYYFYRIASDGITQPEVTGWFQTFTDSYVPISIDEKNIIMHELKTEAGNFRQLRANVTFEPAKDRSCNYNILSWTGDHRLVSFYLIRPLIFSFSLRHLRYSENNTIFVSSINEDEAKASSEAKFTFWTPPCLEMHYNLTICPPPKVTGLVASENHKNHLYHDVTIKWDKADLFPNNYTVQLICFHHLHKESHYVTVPGNATEVVMYNMKLKSQYQVTIIAESSGGVSPKATILKKIIVPSRSRSLYTDKTYYIVASVSALALLVFAAVSVIVIFRLKKNGKKERSLHYMHLEKNFIPKEPDEKVYKKQIDHYRNIGVLQENTPILEDKMELCPDQLEIRHILGSGAYGVVRLGLIKRDFSKTIKVAVKMLKDDPSSKDLNDFYQEIMMMKSAGQHPNIVSLLGCCTVNCKPVLIVEYCAKGDLQSYLRKIWENMVTNVLDMKTNIVSNKGNELGTSSIQQPTSIINHLYDVQQNMINSPENITETDLLNFARQVANGMEYLSANRIIHRDLAARNVLVCEDNVVKISDFGLSRDIYQENVYKKQGNGKLPIKWMAIESLTHQIYTSYSDVWSYGILLWEIVTMGATPYPSMASGGLLKLLQSGYRMERPPNCGSELYDLMLSCWNTRPQSRPSFTEIRITIDNLLNKFVKCRYLNLTDILNDNTDYHWNVEDAGSDI